MIPSNVYRALLQLIALKVLNNVLVTACGIAEGGHFNVFQKDRTK
jgi:hypothetical protein